MPALFDPDRPPVFALADGRLTYRGHRGARTIEGCRVERGQTTRIRLPKAERLAGHRRLVFTPGGDAARARRAFELFSALGVPAPQVVGATLDGAPHLLWAHVGGRFLRDHFGDHARPLCAIGPAGATPVRRASAADAARYAALQEDAGAAFACLLDLPRALRYLAACRVLRRRPRPLAFDTDAGAVLIPSAHDEVSEIALDGSGDSLVDECLRLNRHFEAYLDALEAALAHRPNPADAAWVARHRGAVRPHATPSRRHFAGPPGQPLEARFRYAGPGRPARAVRVVLDDRAHPLTYDPGVDRWRAPLPRPAAPARYRFEITDIAGATQRTPTGTLDPSRLDTLDHVATLTLAVDQPSGLAWLDGSLLVVGDEHQAVYRVDPTSGAQLDRIPVEVGDLEAIDVDHARRELVLVPERDGRLVRIALSGEARGHTRIAGVSDGNAGLEGLAIHPGDGRSVLAKEKDPAVLIRLDARGETLTRRPVDFARDISELAWSDAGWLYALSHEDRALIRLDDDLTPIARWGLPLRQPEGLVVRHERVYVCCDASSELLVLDFDPGTP